MNRDIEQMSERELLAELVLQGRRAERADRIKTYVLAAVLLVIIISGLIIIPKVLAPIRQISENMNKIEESFEEAKRVLSSFDEDTADQFKQTMESLNETAQQARVFMDKLRESGLEDLQSTIERFNETIGSILQFFRR